MRLNVSFESVTGGGVKGVSFGLVHVEGFQVLACSHEVEVVVVQDRMLIAWFKPECSHHYANLIPNAKRINAALRLVTMVDFVQFGLDLLGVLIGVWVAFRLDRFQELRNKIDENIRVLELLGRELELNLGIIRVNIRSNLEKLKIPYAPLELAIWNAVSNKIDLITNGDALQAIAKAYYQFDTLEKAMETLVDHETASFLPSDEKMRKELYKRVLNHIKVILEHLREPKDGQDKTIILFTTHAISEVNGEIKRLRARKRPSLKAILLMGTLISGIILVCTGLAIQIQNSGGTHYNLSTFSAGAIVGWDPFNAPVNPQIAIGIVPFINDTITSSLIINVNGRASINGPFTFGFISPFMISSAQQYPSPYKGIWSYENVSNLGSIIYYRQRLNFSQTIIEGSSVFNFTNLPGRFDHGSYRVFIPFAGGYTYQFQSTMNMTYRFTYDRGVQNFLLDLDIPWTYLVTSSNPSFTSNSPQFGPFCCGLVQKPPLQALEYHLNGSTSVSVSYENSDSVSQFVTLQNWELFSLGLGLPLALSSLLEFAKLHRDRNATRGSRIPRLEPSED